MQNIQFIYYACLPKEENLNIKQKFFTSKGSERQVYKVYGTKFFHIQFSSWILVGQPVSGRISGQFDIRPIPDYNNLNLFLGTLTVSNET